VDHTRLIVGLGNPGPEYARTRHNIGFMLADKVAELHVSPWTNERRFKTRIAKYRCGAGQVVLLQPTTYMNLSGEAVRSVASFYRVKPESILVVVDDADLPLGQLRMRPEGSSGGHHGLDSLEQQLGTRQYPRLRLGIGRRDDGRRDIAGYVLQPFAAEDEPLLAKVLVRAAQQAECWLEHGVSRAMNEFNGMVESTAQN
jgi:peptidyl-tRNA hydrolase, PTH1 family